MKCISLLPDHLTFKGFSMAKNMVVKSSANSPEKVRMRPGLKMEERDTGDFSALVTATACFAVRPLSLLIIQQYS
jgi:hypothetical protein